MTLKSHTDAYAEPRSRAADTRLSVAILTLCLLQIHGNAVSAGLAEIGRAFPALSQTTVSLLLTVANISIVPGMLVSGAFAERFGARRLVLAGFGLALVSGVLAFFLRDFGLLLAARALTGLGVGLVAPFQTSLIPRYFDGYAAQRLFGLQSAGISILGVFYGVAGGWLVGYGWNRVFLVYLIAFAGIAVTAAWLPDGRLVLREGDAPRQRFRINQVLGYITGMHCLFAICMFEYAAGISYLLEETGIGTAGAAGTCVSLFSLGSFGSSLLYGRLSRRFGIGVLPWGYLLAAGGLVLAGQVRGIGAAYAGSVLVGMAIGTIMPALSNKITTEYRDSNPSLAAASFMGAFFVAQLLAAYVMDGISRLPGGGTESGRFLYAAGLTLALAIVSALTWRRFLGTPAAAAETKVKA